VQRRYWVAVEAQSLGRGGPARVAAATGVSLPMIRRGLREVAQGTPELLPSRQRRPGGGRKSLLARDAELLPALLAQIPGEQAARGREPLLWLVSSAGLLAEQLTVHGHRVSAQSVATLLLQRGYTLRATRAIQTPSAQHQYRSRYQYLSARTAQFIRCGQPVLYLRSYCSRDNKGRARRARADYAAPGFALGAVQSWWQLHTAALPLAQELLIALDAEIAESQEASWHTEVRQAARALGIGIQLCAMPPSVHRFRWRQKEASFSSEVAHSPQLRTRQTAVISLVTPGALGGLPHKTYLRSHPTGLISAADRHSPWSLCAWLQPGHRGAL
jgi:hypothetical protein